MKKTFFSLLSVFILLLSAGCAPSQNMDTTVPEEATIAAEAVTSQPTEQLHSDDWHDVHTTANLFAAGYFHGNKEILKPFLADTFEGEVEVYSDYYSPDEVTPNIRSIKGLDGIAEMAIGELCYPSIEFFSSLAGDDSYTYLSMVMVKQENGWKVQSYGLEK